MRTTDFQRYAYVGPEEIRNAVSSPSAPIRSETDLRQVLAALGIRKVSDEDPIATFVIDLDGFLHLAHRRSEHVVCAGGFDILSAGEMTFAWTADGVMVESVTNQSTGYCPEPQSWPAVALALEYLGIAAPKGFSPEFIFRRCPKCGQINLVKESHFYCAVCEAELPKDWNFH